MKRGGVISGLAVVLFLLFALSVSVVSIAGSVSATADVAYIYKNKLAIDSNIMNVFSQMNLSVDKIIEKNVPTTNFSKYKLIFVGDERFSYPNRIPVNIVPSIVSNYYYGLNWGLTDRDGISKLASNSPLSIRRIDNGVLQVYTQSTEKTIGIPYYYLDDENKAPGMQSIARTYTGNSLSDFGDVIAYAPANTLLKNGNLSKGKTCFYGIIKTKYWTSDAKNFFIDCVNYVGNTCSSDLDCASPTVGNKYCSSNNVYQNTQTFHCENPGTAKSQCVDDVIPNLAENCSDGNIRTIDSCYESNGTAQCRHEPIACFNNLECGTNGFIGNNFCDGPSGRDILRNFQTFTCNNPGQLTSFCTNSTQAMFNQTCSDSCDSGVCRRIVCTNNSQCNDENIRTEDICINPGTFDSRCENRNITCFNNLECGTNLLSGNLCSGLNVIQNFLNFTCLNPGTAGSSCANNSGIINIQTCTQQCALGKCLQINCSTNSQCNDGQARTFDECINPNTTASFCRNTEVNCLDNNDCGITGFTGSEYCSGDSIFKNFQTSVCLNPGTLSSSCTNTLSAQSLQDCGQDSCGNFSSNYCKSGDVYHSRTCFDRGCSLGRCFLNSLDVQEDLVEECDYGCSLGQCNPQCTANSDCGNSSFILECSGNYLVNIITNPKCMNGNCGLEVINNTQLCAFGCSNSACIAGVHDVGLIDFTNSVNKIFLEYSNGTDILNTNAIIGCNNIIKAKVKTENIGNFYENVTLTGNIAGNPFSLSAIPNLAPGASSERTSLTPYINLSSLPSGLYNIIINAIIPLDSNPGDNTATRQIQITCQNIVCYNNSGCGMGTWLGSPYCSGSQVLQDSGHPKCFNPGTTGSYCGMENATNIIQTCPSECSNGACNNETTCDDIPIGCVKSGNDLICTDSNPFDRVTIDNFGFNYNQNFNSYPLAYTYKNTAGSGDILSRFNIFGVNASEVTVSLFFNRTYMDNDSYMPGNPTKDILQVGIINSDWNKNTVTWGNHPLLGDIYSETTIDQSQAALLCSTVYGTCSPGTGQFIDFNITPIYKLWKSGTANNGFYIQSKYGDYAYPPGFYQASGNFFNKGQTVTYKDVC